MDDKDERLQRKLSVNIKYLKCQRLISDLFGGSKNLNKSKLSFAKINGCVDDKELLLNLKHFHFGELSVYSCIQELKIN